MKPEERKNWIRAYSLFAIITGEILAAVLLSLAVGSLAKYYFGFTQAGYLLAFSLFFPASFYRIYIWSQKN